MTGRPKVLRTLFQGIPADLRNIPRWVMWRHVERTKPNGEKVWAKLPMTPGGRAASSTDEATWSTYDEVCDALILGEFSGIGLVLGDDVQGIDLDDCRDPDTGELSELAQEVLEKVEGYAEVSPSGTGIKLFSKTNLDTSRTKKEAGVELYREGRYFTVTGHQINGHEALPDEVQDLSWLVEKVFDQELSPDLLEGDAGERALALYKEPLEGWDLDRVVEEVLPHLDPDCGYEEWLKIGAALHHQGQGAEDWLDAWDMWSQGSNKWADGYCAEKWRSFSEQRARGRGAITLASLLKATKDKRRSEIASITDQFVAAIEACLKPQELQDQVAAKIANTAGLSDMNRELLAAAIQKRAKALGVKLPIATARGWVRQRLSPGWSHCDERGNPLCTLENFRALLARIGYTVRYNVIKKAIEIVIPGAVFTRDNQDNAAIAHILSECEKVRMPTKHVNQFMITLADENQYNPVAVWVQSRPWDGKSRIEEFCDTVLTTGDEKLKKLLIRKWLMQCVAAAMSPDGIANQGVLTFVGPQNIGKTTWFQNLAPRELGVVLTGHTLDTRSKDSIFVALSFWIVELGEVDTTFRKSDISALKSFVTAPLDKIRRPYAATESSFGRRTAFGATVNDQLFLHDRTGNRRFWTLEVVSFDFTHNIDMQQLWAEVLELWRAGETWALDRHEVEMLNETNLEFTAIDPIEERLCTSFEWPDSPTQDQPWEWVTASEAVIRVGVANPTKAQTIIASRVLRRLNGDQRRKSNSKIVFAVPGAIKHHWPDSGP